MERRRLTATIQGFPAWVLSEYLARVGEDERTAISYLVKRWSECDPHAKDLGLTHAEFRSARGGGEVVGFPRK